MPLRTYEHFEAGRGKMTYDKIVRFAEATNSDPVAILLTIPLKSPEFALRCADNKLMTILTIALGELNEELGNDIEFIEPGTLIGVFTRVVKDLTNHVANRDLFAETWLNEKVRRSMEQGPQERETGDSNPDQWLMGCNSPLSSPSTNFLNPGRTSPDSGIMGPEIF